MQQKVAITSPLPQTTRKNMEMVFHHKEGTMILIDTPGIMEKVEDLIGKKINMEANRAINGAEVIVMVVDISRPKNEEENKAIGIIRKSAVKKILVYNKIDKAVGSKDHLAEYTYLEDEFDDHISISGLLGKHIESLVKMIFSYLPLIDESEIKRETDFFDSSPLPLPSKEFVAELIREKAYLFLREEVPYSVNVVVSSIKEKGGMIIVTAKIETVADRYKKMIIGQGGKKIKEIGYNARKELELMSQKKIYLELTVETNPHWMEDINK